MSDWVWGTALVAGAVIFTLVWWVAENAHRESITVRIVAIEPLCHFGDGQFDNGYYAVAIAEGRPLRANAFLVKKLECGRYELEVAGWELPALGKYRRVTRIIRKI